MQKGRSSELHIGKMEAPRDLLPRAESGASAIGFSDEAASNSSLYVCAALGKNLIQPYGTYGVSALEHRRKVTVQHFEASMC